MDGVVYHASKIQGLKELDPKKSLHEVSHDDKFIYASRSKELSMILSMRMTDLHSVIMGEGTVENPAIIVERTPGIFDKYLHNSTNIYTLDAKDFFEGTAWKGEVTTNKVQDILNEEYIEDVYSEIEKAQESGNIKLYHYPDRPPEIPLDNSDLIEHLMLPIMKSTHNYKIVGEILKEYPKLLPKVLKSLAKEMKETLKNKIKGNKEEQKLLINGVEKQDNKRKEFLDNIKVEVNKDINITESIREEQLKEKDEEQVR